MSTQTEKQRPPFWYDKSKLKHTYYADGYSGWVIDCGDGTCRYVNSPLLGADPGVQADGTTLTQAQCDEINRKAPRWGDRVKWANGRPDATQIVERWQPEIYDKKGRRVVGK